MRAFLEAAAQLSRAAAASRILNGKSREWQKNARNRCCFAPFSRLKCHLMASCCKNKTAGLTCRRAIPGCLHDPAAAGRSADRPQANRCAPLPRRRRSTCARWSMVRGACRCWCPRWTRYCRCAVLAGLDGLLLTGA